MPDPIHLVLRSLQTSCALSGRSEVSAADVNALGKTLGLPDEALLHAIEQLKADGLIDLRWGGTVTLTSIGRGRDSSRPGGGNTVILGFGGVYAPNSSGPISTNTGTISIAAGEHAAVMTNAAADLAALLQALRTPITGADEATTAATSEVTAAAERVLTDLQQPSGPEPKSLRRHVERLRAALRKLREIAEPALDLGNLWELGHKIVEVLGGLVPPG